MSEDRAIFTPSDFIRHLARERRVSPEEIRVPNRLLITYHTRVYKYAEKLINGQPVEWWIYDGVRPLCTGVFAGKKVGVANIWVGAPAAVMTLEELIACGARTIFEVGLCGGLQPSLEPGSIIVVTEAIRDEGTSHHYLPEETRVESSERLRFVLIDRLKEKRITHHVGRVWSTDGVYRETVKKFRAFKNAGVLGVDMETSAILALAKYRGVKAASGQVVSDILSEEEWQTHFFGHKSVTENTEILTKSVLETLSES